MKAVFFGEFTLGEHPENFHISSFKKAKKEGGDLFCLVNDIDFARRVALYNNLNQEFGETSGLDWIIDSYTKSSGNWCGNRSGCKIQKDWNQVVDEDAYRFAVAASSKRSIETRLGNETFKTLIREDVIPTLIQNRLDLFSGKTIIPITERYLRNFSSSRVQGGKKKSSKRSWRLLFEKAGIVEKVRGKTSTVASCGGIMLALFFRLAELKYTSVKLIISPETKKPLENGIRLLREIQKNTNDPRWYISVKYEVIE